MQVPRLTDHLRSHIITSKINDVDEMVIKGGVVC